MDEDHSFGLGQDPEPRPTSVLFRTETGSLYEVEERRMRRLSEATTPRMAERAGEAWSPIEGHSEIRLGHSVLIYWKTSTLEDGRWRIESTITSPVVEILSEDA